MIFQDKETEFGRIDVVVTLPTLNAIGEYSSFRYVKYNATWGDLISQIKSDLLKRLRETAEVTGKMIKTWTAIENSLLSFIHVVAWEPCREHTYVFKDISTGREHKTVACSEAKAKSNIVFGLCNGHPASSEHYKRNSAKLQLVRSNHPDYDSVHRENLSKDLEAYLETGEFYVFNTSNGGKPTVKHDSFESAAAEATRLSGRQPGHEFHVLKKTATIKGEVQTQIEMFD